MDTTVYQTPSSPVTSGLLWCGVISPLLFIPLFLTLGATRPGYSAWHHFVSELSLGRNGWMQIANFLVCGALMLCFALGLRQALRSGRGAALGPLLFGVFGLALLVAGVFLTDPDLGYPPGTIGKGPQTLHGTIHGVAGLVVFTSLAVACFVMAWRFAGDPAWKRWVLPSVFTGMVVLGCFIASITVAALDENGLFPDSPTGLLQRIAIVCGWGWIMLLSLRLLSLMCVSPSLAQGPAQAEVSDPTTPWAGR